MKCLICGDDSFKDVRAFSIHLCKKHHIKQNEYYSKYIDTSEHKCAECGKDAKFLNITEGFSKYCSRCQKRIKIQLAYKNMSAEHKNEILKKGKQTRLRLYGFENYNNTSQSRKTKRERYGNENYNNREKAKRTYPTQTEVSIRKQKETHFKNWLNKFKEKMEKCNCTVTETDGYHVNLKCNTCKQEFSLVKPALNNCLRWNVFNICPTCFPSTKTSRAEKDLFAFIRSLNEACSPNDKTVLGRKEIDVYVPDKKIGFEYDGLFWHSIERTGSSLLEKTELCEAKGIQLIHIFEDEWLFKQDIVKSRISGLLGHNEKIYARLCECKEIANKEAEEFLNKNHLQGSCVSKYRYGLYYKDRLLSVMTFGKSRFKKDEFELLRFANTLNVNVIGGASKLFKHFLNDHKDINTVITFADRRWSQGHVYEKMGFERIDTIKPNMFYILKGRQRVSRFYSWKNEIPSNTYTINDCGNYKYRFTRPIG